MSLKLENPYHRAETKEFNDHKAINAFIVFIVLCFFFKNP